MNSRHESAALDPIPMEGDEMVDRQNQQVKEAFETSQADALKRVAADQRDRDAEIVFNEARIGDGIYDGRLIDLAKRIRDGVGFATPDDASRT